MQLEADPSPAAATLEHEQVAAVGVDVHQVGVEGADPQQGLSARGGRARVRAGLRHRGSPPCWPCAAPSGATLRTLERAQTDPASLLLQTLGGEAVELDHLALGPLTGASCPVGRLAPCPRCGARPRSGCVAVPTDTRTGRCCRGRPRGGPRSGSSWRCFGGGVERLDVLDQGAREHATVSAGGRARRAGRPAGLGGRPSAARSASGPGRERSRGGSA